MNILSKKIDNLGGVTPLNSTKFRGLTFLEIQSLEEALEFKVPEDYKGFLNFYGECHFNRSVEFSPLSVKPLYIHPSEVDIPNFDFFGSGLSFFYGYSQKRDEFTLLESLNTYRDRIPDGCLPIAEDGFGNQILVSLKENNGWIYWWDHENEWDEEMYFEDVGKKMPSEVKFQNIYLVSYSLFEFIEKLTVCEMD